MSAAARWKRDDPRVAREVRASSVRVVRSTSARRRSIVETRRSYAFQHLVVAALLGSVVPSILLVACVRIQPDEMREMLLQLIENERLVDPSAKRQCGGGVGRRATTGNGDGVQFQENMSSRDDVVGSSERQPIDSRHEETDDRTKNAGKFIRRKRTATVEDGEDNQPTQEHHERRHHQHARIHLSMVIPPPDDEEKKKLNESQSIEYDYGKIYSREPFVYGFVPNPDRENNRSLVFRMWKVADVHNSTNVSSAFRFESERGTIEVLRSGVYLVYSQIRYIHQWLSGYDIMRDGKLLLRCVSGIRNQTETYRVSNCPGTTTAALHAGARLWMQDMSKTAVDPRRYVEVSRTDQAITAASNFWGLVRLSDL